MATDVIDRKIAPLELGKNGLIVNGEEILPPMNERTQAHLRYERRIPYFKFCGRVYYNQSDLMEWAKKQKINVAL